MIARYNKRSFVLGIPGLLIQGYGYYMRGGPDGETASWLALSIGTVLLIAGLVYYAKAKGRSPNWAFMGFLGLIGLIVLAVLPDLAKDGKEPPAPR